MTVRRSEQCGRTLGGAVLLLLLAACAPTPEQKPAPPPAVAPAAAKPVPSRALAPSAFAAQEAAVVQQINSIRQREGLPPLRQNEQLAAVARTHSRGMAERNFFSHKDPAGAEMSDRVKAAGIAYANLAENIARNAGHADPVTTAVKGWMDSPGHRKNILHAKATETGVGIWQQGKDIYFTQLFMKPR